MHYTSSLLSSTPSGNLVWASVLVPSYWLVGTESFQANGTSLRSPPSYFALPGRTIYNCPLAYCPTVIDTGTSIIIGPSYMVQPLIKAVGPVYKNCSNVNSLPTLAFTFNPPDASAASGATTLPLLPSQYVLQYEGKHGLECVLGIEVADLVAPFIILGDPFLRAVRFLLISSPLIFSSSTTPSTMLITFVSDSLPLCSLPRAASFVLPTKHGMLKISQSHVISPPLPLSAIDLWQEDLPQRVGLDGVRLVRVQELLVALGGNLGVALDTASREGEEGEERGQGKRTIQGRGPSDPSPLCSRRQPVARSG